MDEFEKLVNQKAKQIERERKHENEIEFVDVKNSKFEI